MLIHPIIDQLKSLRLNGMAITLEEQMQLPDIASLSFEERLGFMVDRETSYRENRKLKTRLKNAKLKQSACIEDIDFRHPRGLDNPLWQNSFPVTGLKMPIISLSQAQPEPVKPISPAPLLRRPAGKAILCIISGYQGSSMTLILPKVMADMERSLKTMQKQNF